MITCTDVLIEMYGIEPLYYAKRGINKYVRCGCVLIQLLGLLFLNVLLFDMPIHVNNAYIVQKGVVEKITESGHIRKNKIYDIVLWDEEMHETKKFYDVYSENVNTGDFIEIHYYHTRNPVDIVAKKNGKVTKLYKEHYADHTVDRIVCVLFALLYAIMQRRFYKKRVRKDVKTKPAAAFRGMWIVGAFGLITLILITPLNVFDNYRLNGVMKLTYCIMVFGEYCYILLVEGGFQGLGRKRCSGHSFIEN